MKLLQAVHGWKYAWVSHAKPTFAVYCPGSSLIDTVSFWHLTQDLGVQSIWNALLDKWWGVDAWIMLIKLGGVPPLSHSVREGGREGGTPNAASCRFSTGPFNTYLWSALSLMFNDSILQYRATIIPHRVKMMRTRIPKLIPKPV